ncbi:MAG: nickel-responsive transcriptional regulator NikR [Candidatus Neomarinimicrobiota bacterium]
MPNLIRFGVSIENSLLEEFDQFIRERNYTNRSEALRDLIREALVDEEWSQNDIIAGGIAFVYDHHQRELVNKLLNIQHDYHDTVISSQHVHLDHDNCLEIVVVKGPAEQVMALYHGLKSLKGVKHIDLIKSTIGERIK